MTRLPDADVLKDLIHYDSESGSLTWKCRDAKYFNPSERFGAQQLANMWNGKCAGKPAFSRLTANGYLAGCVFGQMNLAHRVVWKMVYGDEPESIDHINGDKANNSIANLRRATPLEQSRNQKVYSNNISGHSGVTFTARGKWKAQIHVRGRNVYLGCYTDKDEAISVRKKAERKFGFHRNHGRVNEQRTN